MWARLPTTLGHDHPRGATALPCCRRWFIIIPSIDKLYISYIYKYLYFIYKSVS